MRLWVQISTLAIACVAIACAAQEENPVQTGSESDSNPARTSAVTPEPPPAPTEEPSEAVAMNHPGAGGFAMVELPYKGRELSMLIIMPDEGKFEEFQECFDYAKLNDIIDGLIDAGDAELVAAAKSRIAELKAAH